MASNGRRDELERIWQGEVPGVEVSFREGLRRTTNTSAMIACAPAEIRNELPSNMSLEVCL
jgi:hypothetical protein